MNKVFIWGKSKVEKLLEADLMEAPVVIDLVAKEPHEYERICRSGKTPVRLKEALNMVLLASGGLSNGEIAQPLSMSAHMA